MSSNFPILVAEDNPVSRKILEKILVKAGHEVVSAGNGQKALELFNEKFFPIVLTDWMMPKMNGLQLCKAIRKKKSTGYVFIILLTARDSKDDIVKGLEAGADDYLCKPFNHAELLARVNSGIRLLKLEKSLKTVNEEIRIMSITDPLTGIYNRGYLTEHLRQEIIRAKRYKHPFSLIICDIDFFKKVNDTYGHQAGDQVLKEFVQSINDLIRNNIDWVARYGGEEFVVVLPETDPENACLVAERLRNTVSGKTIYVRKKKINITASFGVSGFDPSMPDNNISHESMINRADKHLYQAKQEGRNRVKGP
ncbi:MAG: diguanylate cyclase response regulator [Desulfuromonadales bacterium C00003093]|nr:MAG: diguanylate cyclase response regulator [Desulfuromonadales bacterium C00003093]